jgi:hypothetical protein
MVTAEVAMVSTTKMTPQRPICTRTEARDAMPGVREREPQPVADRFERGQESRNIEFEKINGFDRVPKAPTLEERAIGVRIDMMLVALAPTPARARESMADGLAQLDELLQRPAGRAEVWKAPDAPVMRAVVEAREELAQRFPNDVGPSGATFKKEAAKARAELAAFLAKNR